LKIYETDAKNAKLCPRCRGGRRYYVPTERVKKSCKNCHKEFETGRADKIFCSAECRRTYHDTSVLKDKICFWCKKPFRTTKELQEYCCKEHYRLAKNKRDLVNIRRIRRWISQHKEQR
jgi:hypothetical protein